MVLAVRAIFLVSLYCFQDNQDSLKGVLNIFKRANREPARIITFCTHFLTTKYPDVRQTTLPEVRRVSVGVLQQAASCVSSGWVVTWSRRGTRRGTHEYPDGIILRLSTELNAEHTRFRILTKPILVLHTLHRSI
jgi:hypothetical protein